MNFSCAVTLNNNECPLGFECWIDQTQIFNSTQITDTVNINCDVTCNPGKHVLKFVIKNKQQHHTQIDLHGKIIKDSCLTISQVSIDNFEIDQKLYDNAIYEHNFNNTGPMVKEKFYQDVGCNGTVVLEFSTPIYEWLSNTYQIIKEYRS